MERNDGLRALLQHPWVYSAFQKAVGGDSADRWLLDNHWKVESGMTVVDVGCGPARLRADLPEAIDYYGFDPNPDYIASAERQQSGTFFVGGMPEFLSQYGEALSSKVDIVICSGVLHHLTTSQMNDVMSGSLELLSQSGRFAALEPAWLARQDHWSKWVLKRDRGTNILYDYSWNEVLCSHFPRAEVRVVNRLIRIPYMYALLTGWKSTSNPA